MRHVRIPSADTLSQSRCEAACVEAAAAQEGWACAETNTKRMEEYSQLLAGQVEKLRELLGGGEGAEGREALVVEIQAEKRALVELQRQLISQAQHQALQQTERMSAQVGELERAKAELREKERRLEKRGGKAKEEIRRLKERVRELEAELARREGEEGRGGSNSKTKDVSVGKLSVNMLGGSVVGGRGGGGDDAGLEASLAIMAGTESQISAARVDAREVVDGILHAGGLGGGGGSSESFDINCSGGGVAAHELSMSETVRSLGEEVNRQDAILYRMALQRSEEKSRKM